MLHARAERRSRTKRATHALSPNAAITISNHYHPGIMQNPASHPGVFGRDAWAGASGAGEEAGGATGACGHVGLLAGMRRRNQARWRTRRAARLQCGAWAALRCGDASAARGRRRAADTPRREAGITSQRASLGSGPRCSAATPSLSARSRGAGRAP